MRYIYTLMRKESEGENETERKKEIEIKKKRYKRTSCKYAKWRQESYLVYKTIAKMK